MLFERAAATAPDVTVAEVRDQLEARRAGERTGDADRAGGTSPDAEPEPGEIDGEVRTEEGSAATDDDGPADRPDPGRIVADADVLAADLLVGGDARAAMDQVRAHRWLELVASDALLADAVAVVAALADEDLAGDWRDRIEARRRRVTQPAGDHPGLASAYAGRAAQLLTFDEGLSSARANLALQDHVRVSVRTPHAFAALFDPERLYPAVVGGDYPGPDADPRG